MPGWKTFRTWINWPAINRYIIHENSLIIHWQFPSCFALCYSMFGPTWQNSALRICIWATTESDRGIASKILWTSGQSLFVSVDDLLSRSWAGVVVWCLVFSESGSLAAGRVFTLCWRSTCAKLRRLLAQEGAHLAILSRSLEQIPRLLTPLSWKHPCNFSQDKGVRRGVLYLQTIPLWSILHLFSWPD